MDWKTNGSGRVGTSRASVDVAADEASSLVIQVATARDVSVAPHRVQNLATTEHPPGRTDQQREHSEGLRFLPV